MTSFLTVQNSYTDIQLALCKDSHIIDSASASKIDASKSFIPLLNALLTKNSFHLSQLNFIAANTGPGPFTTLRTVLASANGLSFATNIPLIGVDALDAMINQTKKDIHSKETSLVILLNAFGKDVYFAIHTAHGATQKGCMNINDMLAFIIETTPENSIEFTGNATNIHKVLIEQTIGSRAIILEPITQTPSIETIAAMALQKWQAKEGLVEQLMPIYLK